MEAGRETRRLLPVEAVGLFGVAAGFLPVLRAAF